MSSDNKMNNKTPCLSITASAPGKIILFGEHSVVYGKFAIAASLGLRTNVEIILNPSINNDKITFNFKDLDFTQIYHLKDVQEALFDKKVELIEGASEFNWENPDAINTEAQVKRIDNFVTGHSFCSRCELSDDAKASLISFFFLYTTILGAFKKPHAISIEVNVKSQLTLNAGLGSSASFLVACTAAIYKMFKTGHVIEADRKLISQWAFNAEKIFHGTPSGIDNTICTYGSMIGFTKGGEIGNIEHPKEVKVLLINTKVPKNTKAQVGKVKTLMDTYPDVVNPILTSMNSIALAAKQHLLELKNDEEENKEVYEQIFDKLGVIADINQSLLKALGASHASIDSICSTMSTFNLHTKLTGAGGGGYCFTLIPPSLNEDKLKEIINLLENSGYEAVLVTLGGQGVVVH